VLHSGSPHGGHYHAYIRDVLGEGNWRVLSGSDAFDTLASHSTAASPAPASSIPTVLEAGSPLPVILQIMSDAPMHPTWKLKFLQLDTLGTQISTVAKASWKAAYRAQYGGMKEFIEKQPVWFEIRGQAVVLKKEPQPSDFTVSEVVASARVSDGTRDDIASVVLAQKLHAEESGSIPGKGMVLLCGVGLKSGQPLVCMCGCRRSLVSGGGQEKNKKRASVGSSPVKFQST
jgi:hypothetical protein